MQQVQFALQGRNAPAGLLGHCELPAGVVGGSHCSGGSTTWLPQTGPCLVVDVEVVDDVDVVTVPFSDGTHSSRGPSNVKLSVSNWFLVKIVPDGGPLGLLIL